MSEALRLPRREFSTDGVEHRLNIEALERFMEHFAKRLHFGEGDPEGVVIADIGAIFMRDDGGAATSFYVKETDPGANTGWVAK
jgi:hypothetical protein